MMNTATIETRIAQSEAECVREHHFASGERGGMVDLTISRERNGSMTVTWAANNGAGWKSWSAKNLGAVKAASFAASKWATLVAWLEKLEPKHVPFCPGFTC